MNIIFDIIQVVLLGVIIGMIWKVKLRRIDISDEQIDISDEPEKKKESDQKVKIFTKAVPKSHEVKVIEKLNEKFNI